MGGIYPNGQRAAQTHSMCQTQVRKNSKDKGHQKSVCTWVLPQGHKAMLIDNKQATKKENLQSPLHPGAGDGSETGSLY